MPMTKIADMPFAWIQFDKKGKLGDPLPAWPIDGTVTDVVIVSHGWKTDVDGASKLYEPLLKNVANAWKAGAPPKPVGRSYGVLGVVWPSKKFEANYDLPIDRDLDGGALDAAGGGGAMATGAGGVEDLDSETFDKIVGDYAEFTGVSPAELRTLARTVVDDGFEPEPSFALLEAALKPLGATPKKDGELAEEKDAYDLGRAEQVLQQLAVAPALPVEQGVGGAKGAGEALGKLIAGPKAAVARLLNQLTFFEMKKRAGVVGAGLAKTVLDPVIAGSAQRIHLVGHSFGARLVTSAAHAARRTIKIGSLTMLQGAFSHNALSTAKGGAFAEAHKKIANAVLITHTHNDKAVTLAYALASRLSRDNSKAIGDKNDQFGAIGANGALALASGDSADSVSTTPLALTRGKVHNLQCNDCIKDHMDVTNPKVAAIVAAVLAS